MIRDDAAHSVSDAVIKQTEDEILFSERYFNRTGIQWRHNYDKGPRPPPTLHMWDAKAIGQIHPVTSSAGYW